MKKIDGFFFCGFDTVFTTSVRSVVIECWEMEQYHRCHGNQMRGDTDIFSFTASPEGEGVWMQSKTYDSKLFVTAIDVKKRLSALSNYFFDMPNIK